MTESDVHQAQYPARQHIELPKRQWMLALCAVTVLAFALRADFVLNAVIDGPIRGDAKQYFAGAWNLIHHHVFSIAAPGSPAVSADSYRDPGFSILLACWLLIFGDTGPWYAGALMTQALLGALTIPLLLSALRPWPSDRWLIGAGVVMAIWPHSITICSYLLTETLFAFLCTLSIFLLSIAIKKKHYGWNIAAGICFSAAALTNAILLPFAALLAISMLVLRRFDKKFALVLILSGILLPLAWQLRNSQLPHTSQTSTDRALTNLVQGSWPEYHSSWRAYALGDADGAIVLHKIDSEYALLRDQPSVGSKAIFNRLASAPGRYFWWYLSKPAELWGWSIKIGQGDVYIYPTSNSPLVTNPVLMALVAVCYMLNPVIALLCAWGGLMILLRKGSSSIAVATTLLTLYATLVYSLLQAEPRYSIPFRGMELALAAVGLWYLKQWWSSIRHRLPLPGNAERLT